MFVGRSIRLKLGWLLILSASLWLALTSFVSAAEKIELFKVDIIIQADGTAEVTEVITYDFGNAQRHGIFRDLDTSHAQAASAWYKKRSVTYDIHTVERNGKTERYNQTGSDVVNLKIGDPNKTISGSHTYTINYTIKNAVSVFDDGSTELYWNVTGSNWPVSLENVQVSVSGAESVNLLPQSACYQGTGSNTSGCTVTASKDSVVFFAQNITPGQQVTVAQALSFAETPIVTESIRWIWFVLGGLFVLLDVLVIYMVRWFRHHKVDGPVVAQYEPYKDFKPMFTGVLIDGRLDSRDVAAGIVYLAQQGFLKITHLERKVLGVFTTTDYEITLVKKAFRAPTEGHLTLIKLLFQGQAGTDEVQHKWKSFWLQKEVQGSMNMYVGKTVRLSDLKKNQKKLRRNYKLLVALKKSVREDLKELGFTEGSLFTRRTRKGYEAINYLKGFKDFLSVTEKERYAFHNAPTKSPEQFMEYLPYAVAFGVEKEWAEVFRDVDITMPDWYNTGTTGRSFVAADFASELSSFSSSLASSGGSSSGSSGGGSAGGGGGGGGGGSW